MKKRLPLLKKWFLYDLALFGMVFFGMLTPVDAQVSSQENPCNQITVSYYGYDYTANLFGSVCWFTQNMRNLQYADGTDIPDVRAYGDDENNVNEYGRLYTWAAATRLPAGTANSDSVQGLCPEGWFIPRAVDFVGLANLLGGVDYMKSSNPSYWLGVETGLSPVDGYKAVPGGLYNATTQRFENILGQSWFWSSSSTTVMPLACLLQYGCPQELIQEANSGNGFSVRCVKYYFPPVLFHNLVLSNPTTSTFEANVSLKTSGSQLPSVKYYVYSDPLCTGTPVAESDYVDAVINASDTTYPTTLTGLTDGTTYYVQAVAYNHFGESASNIATAATKEAPKLHVSTPWGITTFCTGGTGVDVKYIATMTGADITDYTLTWTVDGVAESVTDTVLTKTYTVAGDVKVVCKAERSGFATLKDSLTVAVLDEPAPSIGVCSDGLMVTLKEVSDVSTLDWGDGSTQATVAVDDDHVYASLGTYTIIATASNGCAVVKPVTITRYKYTACNLAEMATTTLLTNEAGTSTQIDSVRDHEGNWYKVVQMGNRCWLRQNMRATTSPSTGSYFVNPLHYTGSTVISNHRSKVAHWYMNDSITYAAKDYGLLYNWCAAMDTFVQGSSEVATASNGTNNGGCWFPKACWRGICPEGWHVANDNDWFDMLSLELSGMESFTVNSTGYLGSGTVFYSSGCDWILYTPGETSRTPNSYDNPERNKTEFCALPGGKFGDSGTVLAGSHSLFWSFSQGTANYSLAQNFSSTVEWPYRGAQPKSEGRSVRCVRDY